MRILVTGATGYVGSRVTRLLLARGDRVLGAVREPGRAAALPAGAEAALVDLERPETLAAAARGVDAVIHAAFPGHGRAWADGVALEARAIAALADALDGSATRLILSNGTLFLGESRAGRLREDMEPAPGHPAAIRAAAVGQARAPGRRLDAVELRLASFVYGHGGSVFLPILLAAARRDRRSLYVGDGDARASTVHVDHAAQAYLTALDHAPPGAILHVAGEEEPTIAEIARAVGIAAGGAPAVAVDVATAAAALDPFTAWFLTVDNRLAADRIRALGWSHAGAPGMLWDVAHGSYAAG